MRMAELIASLSIAIDLGAQMPMGARLLAAADAYQAMREERPWREALAPEKATAELRKEAAAGRLDAAATEVVLEAAGQGTGRIPPTPGDLSAREIEVLRLIAKGISNKEMGAALFIGIPATGKEVSMGFISVDTYKDGKLRSIRVNTNMLSLMQQLGAIPAPAHV